MAIKGFGYIKTTWAFQERPVASAKLNLWDDRVEAALELVYALLSLAWGGGDGVLRRAGSGELAVAATEPPGLSVVVQPGYAFIAREPFNLAEATETPGVMPPSAKPRIDLVQARLHTWTVGVKTGAEAAAPAAPEPDPDCIALAHLHLRPGMEHITAADDGVNGYIADVRAFL